MPVITTARRIKLIGRIVASSLGLAAMGEPCAAHGEPPAPQGKAACVAAFERGQELEKAGQLVEARSALAACGAAVCPGIVRNDCLSLRASIDTSLPTIVLGARDGAGNDLVDVEVRFDGKVLTTKLDGQPVPVNPGPHVLRFEALGMAPAERKVVIRVGEKNRVVTIDLQGSAGSSGDTTDPAAGNATGGKDEGAQARASRRIGSYVLGGVGAVSLGAFAFLGITGKNELANLQNTCGKTHTCASKDVDATKVKLIAADVSLGVGIAALGSAAILFATSFGKASSKAQSATQVIVAPVPGGMGGMVVGRF